MEPPRSLAAAGLRGEAVKPDSMESREQNPEFTGKQRLEFAEGRLGQEHHQNKCGEEVGTCWWANAKVRWMEDTGKKAAPGSMSRALYNWGCQTEQGTRLSGTRGHNQEARNRIGHRFNLLCTRSRLRILDPQPLSWSVRDSALKRNHYGKRESGDKTWVERKPLELWAAGYWCGTHRVEQELRS